MYAVLCSRYNDDSNHLRSRALRGDFALELLPHLASQGRNLHNEGLLVIMH